MLKIRTKYLVYYLCIFILCIPSNSKYPKAVGLGLNVLTAIACAIAVFVFFYHKYYRRKALYPLFLWFFWVMAATLINGTDIVTTISTFVAPALCCSILVIFVFDCDCENAFGVIAWMFTILMVLQALSFATHIFGTVFLGGKTVNVYFFGIRIQINKIVPFAVFFGFLNYKFGKRNSPWSLIISTACGLYFALGEMVSNSLICYVVIALVFILSWIIRSEHMLRNLTILVLGLSVIVFLVYAGRNNITLWFINDLMGKENATLDGRTLIWEQAIKNIKGIHWIIGNGNESNFTFSLGTTWETHATHNTYLEIIFCFGIIGLGLYIWMCVQQFRTVRYHGSRFATRAFVAVFIAMAVMQITATVFEKPYYYIFFIASLYLPQIARFEKEPRRRVHITFGRKTTMNRI